MNGHPGSNNPNTQAYLAAKERASQLASKLIPESGTGGQIAGLKRPFSDNEGPDTKKPNMEDNMSEDVAVPDNMVGMIIGRGGDQITRLQQESGCKIQMAPDTGGGQPHRTCTLTGSPASRAHAKSLIEAVISSNSNMKQNHGGPGHGGGGRPGGQSGMITHEMMVPGHKVGLIIGKGGETIKMLQEETNAKIAIIQDSNEHADQKPLRISGPAECVENAKVRVEGILSSHDNHGPGFNRGGRGGGQRGGGFAGRGGRGWHHGGGGAGHPNGETVDYVVVTSDKVGLVIGKGGETIKSINQASGAHCEIDKKAPPEATEKNFIIRGSPDAVERAKQMVLEKIGAAPGSGYGSFPGQTFVGGNPSDRGGFHGKHDPPQTSYPGAAANSQAPQDYSAQWAQYYRSVGMLKEAEMIEQQGGGSAAPVQTPQQAAGTQDYSAQWADYYRSIGKVKEAEAIEAQMRAKANPPMSVPSSGQPGYPAQGYYPPQQHGYPGYD